MELALSLGETPKVFSFLDKPQKIGNKFCMGLVGEGGESGGRESSSSVIRSQDHNNHHQLDGLTEDRRDSINREELIRNNEEEIRSSSSSEHTMTPLPPLQLDLLPFSPVPRKQQPSHLRFPWLADNLVSEAGSSDGPGKGGGLDVNRKPLASEEGPELSSPNSAVSSFPMDLSIYRSGRCKRDLDITAANDVGGGTYSRASDEEENGLARKKLRLTKDQSAFLEESFKEHNTLNPKQKLALAKQLNLRPRQVEVWFQNRRARTKLKQTEVDCEYLKRCCETLTEENRRLQKELQELRALKSSQPFYMQLPATTLTMCPSCERVASTSTTAVTTSNAAAPPPNTALSLAKPSSRLFPFSHAQVQAPPPHQQDTC